MKECKNNVATCNHDKALYLMKYEIDTNQNILMSILKNHIDDSAIHISERERKYWDSKADREALVALENRINEKVDAITGDTLREIVQEISGNTIGEIVTEVSGGIITNTLSNTIEGTIREVVPGMISSAIAGITPNITWGYQDLIP